jgi:TonB-linked SusC/RagA family outer membrane protein
MRKFLTIFSVLMLSAIISMAQKAVTGTVRDDKGTPIQGVSVKVKGTAVSATTDADGVFTIKAADGAELVFSGGGTTGKTVTVSGGNVDVVLARKFENEIVVTGIGQVTTKLKNTTNVAKVKSAELNQAKPVNVAQGLVGKVSGLNITGVNSGVFQDTRITLRGIRSLTGNNQPLLVVDGLPISLGYLNTINPNDIQDINILKGASAAAIYGPDGVNGVIIVTTVKGKSKTKPEITVSTTVQMENVSFLPKFQTRFGSGSSEDANGFGLYTEYENQSYGPEFDGSIVQIGRDGPSGEKQLVPYSALPNEKLNFFDQGLTIQKDISFRTAEFYLSVQDVSIKGTMPKDENRRTSFRLNSSREYNKFKADFNLQYTLGQYDVHSNANRDYYAYWNVINTPQHIPITKYKNWNNPSDYWATPSGYFNDYYHNPYWAIDNFRDRGRSDDFIGNITFNYKFNNWLNFTSRTGSTLSFANNKTSNAATFFSPFAKSNGKSNAVNDILASVSDGSSFSNRITTENFFTLRKDIKDFNIEGILGHSFRQIRTKGIGISGSNLAIPTLFNVSNRTGEPGVSESNSQQRLVRFFGRATINYKTWATLELVGSFDQDSRIAKQNRKVFYPGVSAAFVASEAIPAIKESKTISYLKIRGGYNLTGNPGSLAAYQLEPVFSAIGGFPYGNLSGFSAFGTITNPLITYESVKSAEVGFDVSFLKDKINLEVTAYRQLNNEQILGVQVSRATGYSTSVTNAASFINRGVEVDLRLTPLVKFGKNWDINLKGNVSYNDNVVTNIFDGLDEFTPGNLQFIINGRPAYTFKLIDYARDDQNRVIVDKFTGYPTQVPAPREYGRTLPVWIVGLTPSVRWKDLSLTVVGDYRGGHMAYHAIGSSLDFTGISLRSAYNGRRPFVMPNSSYFDGTKYVPNTNITTQSGGYGFWETAANNTGVQSNYATSAAAWKIREVSLAYNLPSKLVAKTKFIKSGTVSLVARNLMVFLPKTNQWTDPEFSNTTGNLVGVNNIFNQPPTRIYGANITLNF